MNNKAANWVFSQPIKPSTQAEPCKASTERPFVPLKGYDLLANVPPNRDYRKYPSLFGSKRVWRDGRTELVEGPAK